MNDKTATFSKKDIVISSIKNNKKKIISLFIIILVILFSFFLLEKKKESKNIETSNKFNKAKILILNKKNNEALKLLELIIDDKNIFYSPLSLYLILDKNLVTNQEKSIALFDKILSNKKIKKDNLDLLKIKKALFVFESISENELLSMLNPIIKSNSPWKNDAREIVINYFVEKGQTNKAEEYKNLRNIN